MMQMEAMVYTVYTAREDRDTPSRRPVYRLSDASSRRFCLIRAVSMYSLDSPLFVVFVRRRI